MKKIISIISLALCACLAAIGFAACDNSKGIADNTEHFDDITKTCKLTKSFEGKCFFSDGIGTATVASYTDGDTTLFNLDVPNSGGVDKVNIRYYSINTPESTGSVEKWGKAASLFTKARLSAAKQIVLEASETPAVTDNYGTRYLGYVWYRTEENGDFKNLNLEIVENGFSDNKGTNTSAFIYYDYFKKANDFAKSVKLRLYSDLDDPLYSTDPVDITLKEFNEHPELYYTEETDSGARVRFTAYLKSLRVSDSGTHTFVAEQYDPATGETYSINVYTGYSSSSASSMKLGHLYQIVGTIQKYYGTFQVAGPDYVSSSKYARPDNTHLKQSNYYWAFNSGTAYEQHLSAMLYSDVTVTSATVSGTKLTIVGTAQKLGKDGYGEAKSYTFEVSVSAGYESTFAAGDKIRLNAYKLDADKEILTVKSLTDISKSQ